LTDRNVKQTNERLKTIGHWCVLTAATIEVISGHAGDGLPFQSDLFYY